MMKNIVRFCVLTVAALFLATCTAGTLLDSPTGSITFAFPEGALSRGIGTDYKVAIYYGLDQYDAAPVVVGNELTFDNLSTGDVRIIVARGTTESDGYFYPEEYGQLFITIVPGVNGPYGLVFSPSKFTWLESMRGADVNGLARKLEDDPAGTFYASTAGSLMTGTYSGGVFSATDGPLVPDGVDVNSISIGKAYSGDVVEEQIWVNGSWNATSGGGIMPWVGDALNLEFSNGFGNSANREDGTVADFEIIYSGAFKAPSEEALALVFRRPGGMGGVYLTSSEFEADLPLEWPWIVDEFNFAELLGDDLAEGEDFVKGLIVSPEASAAYVITAFATLKVSEELLSSDSGLNSAGDILNSDFVAYAPDFGSNIVSIDLGGSGQDEVVYIGTENGIYAGPSSADPAEFFDGGEFSLIKGTAGYYIKLISASPDGGMVAFSARRGNNAEFLIIVDTDTDEVIDVRSLQGLPGSRLSNLVWLDDSVLAVSGDRGLVALDAGSLF